MACGRSAPRRTRARSRRTTTRRARRWPSPGLLRLRLVGRDGVEVELRVRVLVRGQDHREALELHPVDLARRPFGGVLPELRPLRRPGLRERLHRHVHHAVGDRLVHRVGEQAAVELALAERLEDLLRELGGGDVFRSHDRRGRGRGGGGRRGGRALSERRGRRGDEERGEGGEGEGGDRSLEHGVTPAEAGVGHFAILTLYFSVTWRGGSGVDGKAIVERSASVNGLMPRYVVNTPASVPNALASSSESVPCFSAVTMPRFTTVYAGRFCWLSAPVKRTLPISSVCARGEMRLSVSEPVCSGRPGIWRFVGKMKPSEVRLGSTEGRNALVTPYDQNAADDFPSSSFPSVDAPT